jgi:D-sedoheptulose 7-phosphate isomerase
MKLAERVKAAKRVYIIGNGGSYANALHIQNDLISCHIRAYTLDPSTLTAIANDYGYENVFSRWLQVVGDYGDMLIALSGSGKSKNILNAVEVAKLLGMDVECVFGAPRLNMQSAEEEQIELGHMVMKCLKSR